MSRPETLASMSNHWRLSCAPIRNVSPSLSPPALLILVVSLFPICNVFTALRSSLALSSAPSLTLVCAVRQEAHSLHASLHWARATTTLDATEKLLFKAVVSLADSFHLAACSPHVFILWGGSVIKVLLFSNTHTP